MSQDQCIQFTQRILTACAIFPHPAAMAGHFKGACWCPVCLTYLENPVNMKCGYICYLGCVSSLRKEPGGDGVLWLSCSEVSQKNDIRPNSQLGRLVSKVKDLEPQLRAILQMNPKMQRFQGETPVGPASPISAQEAETFKAPHYMWASTGFWYLKCLFLPRDRCPHL